MFMPISTGTQLVAVLMLFLSRVDWWHGSYMQLKVGFATCMYYDDDSGFK